MPGPVDVLAMFPLGTVLVPGAVLPLHLFEPRYRALARDCTAGRPEFGVVLIERGSEVGGGDVRGDVGCVARIAEAEELADGRWVLLVVGTDRIRVRSWLADAPYPRAEVEPWPDPVPGPEVAGRVGDLVARTRRVLAGRAELGDAVTPATFVVDDDPATALWQVVAAAPVATADRYRLLAAPSPGERVAQLSELLADEQRVVARRMAQG